MTQDHEDIRELTAPDEVGKERVDRWLAGELGEFSRSRLKAMIEDGRLSCNGAPLTDPSAKLAAGASYRLSIPPVREAAPKPEDIPLDVLFEDDHLIVLLKPAGLTVHPGAGAWTGTLVHALLHHCRGSLSGIGGVERPGIVHRLDKDTSGVLVAAKTDQAHQGLSAQFAAHTVERAYTAFVRGAPDPKAGRIETRIARAGNDRTKMGVIEDLESEVGKYAATNYETQATYGQDPKASIGRPIASKVECRLETGRTHQIRVHMAHVGAPLLGDPLYGARRGLPNPESETGRVLHKVRRQALHAAILGFEHPATGETLRFQTEPPKDMQRLEKFLERL
jgi:23S rRNA pseudouridine1911/1915/1917 synthase